MNIALMSHDRKKELMVQFCIAYCGILSKHTVCATNTTGKLVAEATGLPVYLFLSHEHGGSQQIGPGSPTTRSTWSSSSPIPNPMTWTPT
jgi:methylglyoxal synthase